jgi:hypothetical protein
MTRRRTLDEWVKIVAARKAEVGEAIPRVKRTLARDPESTAALVELAVARMARRFPELFEVLGPRRFRLRPVRGSRRVREQAYVKPISAERERLPGAPGRMTPA